MDNNIDVLDELNKGCSMGVDALDIILPRVEEYDFKELLENQLEEYKNIAVRIDDLYREFTSSDLHETSALEKAMTWYGITKDTVLDNSISKLADLLVKGTNMGIIEGRRILNHKKMDKKVKKLCGEYVKMQEKYLESLKDYL